MAIKYDYSLSVWLRIETPPTTLDLADQLREYLDGESQILKLKVYDESESETEGEITISLQLQVTFDELQMDGDEPTEEALEELNRELRPYLEAKFAVTYMELLDDAPTSYLISEREDD